MERIPRVGSTDVVFFMHGLFDTSLSWVSAGKGLGSDGCGEGCAG